MEETEDDKDEGDEGDRINFAGSEQGALIMDKAPDYKGANNLLIRDKEKYGLVPCGNKQKWVVIGLSEEVSVKEIQLENWEKYASTVKSFQLMVSRVFPTKRWLKLGSFIAKSMVGVQKFEIADETKANYMVRFLKIQMLTHYNAEHYCTLSRIRVHGLTGVQTLAVELEKSAADLKEKKSNLIAGLTGDEDDGEDDDEDDGELGDDTDAAGVDRAKTDGAKTDGAEDGGAAVSEKAVNAATTADDSTENPNLTDGAPANVSAASATSEGGAKSAEGASDEVSGTSGLTATRVPEEEGTRPTGGNAAKAADNHEGGAATATVPPDAPTHASAASKSAAEGTRAVATDGIDPPPMVQAASDGGSASTPSAKSDAAPAAAAPPTRKASAARDVIAAAATNAASHATVATSNAVTDAAVAIADRKCIDGQCEPRRSCRALVAAYGCGKCDRN